jgi:HD-GYP domain-containing protein (c-di-GMP phosphodiesterase class II)
MRLVATRQIEPGMTLAADVFTTAQRHLPYVRAGVRLEEHHRSALVEAGIGGVYIEDRLSAGTQVTPALSEATRSEATRVMTAAFAEVAPRRVEGRSLPAAAVAEISAAVKLICRDLAEADHVALALTDLGTADAYTLQHSIDVATVGLLIARRHFRDHGRPGPRHERRLDRIEQYLTKLGVGLLLHDIGKLALPTAILKKPGELTEEERAIVREHPLLGVGLMRGDVIGPLAKSVIRWHHERWDGSGYPDGRAGLEIPEFARIAAVADVFDAVTSARVYAPAAPTEAGVRVILQGCGKEFDPEIVATFCTVVAPYPAGTQIRLADGSSGIVVSVPLHDMGKPRVRLLWDPQGRPVEDPVELDLRERPSLVPSLKAA